jgi:hypothetical protein
MVVAMVAVLGGCEYLGLGDYCEELPEDGFCTGPKNPTIFD